MYTSAVYTLVMGLMGVAEMVQVQMVVEAAALTSEEAVVAA